MSPIAHRANSVEVPAKLAPLVPGRPLSGSLQDLKRDPIGLFTRAALLGDVVRMEFPYVSLHLFAHPDHVRRVLVEQHRAYGKQTNGHRVLKLFLGEGMLVAEGEAWRKKRRLAQPAFHHQEVGRFSTIMSGAAQEMIARWNGGGVIDADAEMMAISLKIVGLALLSTDLSDRTEEVSDALTTVLGQLGERTTFLFPDMFFPAEDQATFDRALAELDSVVEMIIEQRKNAKNPPRDLLTLLMSAQDEETGERLDTRGLRDEVMTLILAGHETTANALTWSLHLLSRDPEAQAKLFAEVTEVLGGEAPSLAHLPRLTYTSAVISEAMRLFPPGWMLTRSVTTDDEVGGFTIPAGSYVLLSSFITHRDARFWPEPERFVPERFIGESTAPRYAYFPFGGGPRQCIGAGFALMEAAIVLASIAQKFELAPADETVTLWPTISLRPKNGLRVELVPR